MYKQLQQFFSFYSNSNSNQTSLYSNWNNLAILSKQMTDQDLVDQFCEAIEKKDEQKQHLLLWVAVKKVEKQLLSHNCSFNDQYSNYADEIFGEFLVEFLRRLWSYNLKWKRWNPLWSNGKNKENKENWKKNLKSMAISLLRALHEWFIQRENWINSIKDLRVDFKTWNVQNYIIPFSKLTSYNDEGDSTELEFEDTRTEKKIDSFNAVPEFTKLMLQVYDKHLVFDEKFLTKPLILKNLTSIMNSMNQYENFITQHSLLKDINVLKINDEYNQEKMNCIVSYFLSSILVQIENVWLLKSFIQEQNLENRKYDIKNNEDVYQISKQLLLNYNEKLIEINNFQFQLFWVLWNNDKNNLILYKKIDFTKKYMKRKYNFLPKDEYKLFRKVIFKLISNDSKVWAFIENIFREQLLKFSNDLRKNKLLDVNKIWNQIDLHIDFKFFLSKLEFLKNSRSNNYSLSIKKRNPINLLKYIYFLWVISDVENWTLQNDKILFDFIDKLEEIDIRNNLDYFKTMNKIIATNS